MSKERQVRSRLHPPPVPSFANHANRFEGLRRSVEVGEVPAGHDVVTKTCARIFCATNLDLVSERNEAAPI